TSIIVPYTTSFRSDALPFGDGAGRGAPDRTAPPLPAPAPEGRAAAAPARDRRGGGARRIAFGRDRHRPLSRQRRKPVLPSGRRRSRRAPQAAPRRLDRGRPARPARAAGRRGARGARRVP